MSPSKLRTLILAAAFLAVALCPRPAHATSKEIVELQTQVQQLLDMVQRLQSTVDKNFGGLQQLVEKTAENSNQMTITVNALQQKINAQTEAAGGKMDTVSGQVQSVNDSLDELKSRIAKLDKSIQEMQAQLQTLQQPSAPGAAPANPASPAGADSAQPQQPGQPAPMPAAGAMQGQQAPPLAETFQAAVRDYNAAHYPVAAGEFQDVIHYYPLDDLAGAAHFYLGEIAYRQNKFTEAVKAYNAVLEGFPGSPKASAAQLRKAYALLAMKEKRDAGIHELRMLIQRHPQTPEAAQARTKLASLGVKVTP
jgi:TolA-binding protein